MAAMIAVAPIANDVPFATAKEDENCFTIVNRKIFEIKKKIQLSEGQRKAYFEVFDAETKLTNEKIQKLKKEIKELTEVVEKSKHMDQSRIRSAKYQSDVGPLGDKTYEEAKIAADLKVIELNKNLDLIRDRYKRRQQQLGQLAEVYKRLMDQKTGGKTKGKVKTNAKQKECSLENEIHRTQVQWMEAEHVNKKYRVIKASLNDDSAKFQSQLEKIEEAVHSQMGEIKKLEEIHNEALNMRDTIKNILNRQEQMAMSASKTRDQQIQEYRQKVDERKVELERLERKIFPSGRPLVHQDSTSTDQQLQAISEENAYNVNNDYLETVFTNLMEATGANAADDVLSRFLSQKTTLDRLTYLRTMTENEKKRFEKKREFLNAQLEAFKFAEVKNKEVNEEELENISSAMKEQQRQQQSCEEKYNSTVELLTSIRTKLLDLCEKVLDFNATPIPEYTEKTTSLVEVLRYFKVKIRSAFEIIHKGKEPVDAEVDSEYERIDEDRLKKITVDVPTSYMAMLENAKPRAAATWSHEKPQAGAGSDEEGEVPSRGFLKRQAQLIVDAKSRRKTFRAPISSK